MIGLLNVHGSSCRFVRYPGYTCTTPLSYGGQVAQLRVFGSWQWAAVVGEGWAQITSGRCSVVEVERGGGGLSRSSILFSNLFLHDPCIATYGDGNMQNLIEVIDWYTWPAHPTSLYRSRLLKNNFGPWKWHHRKKRNCPRNIVCIKTVTISGLYI